jgi:hypothetical protein
MIRSRRALLRAVLAYSALALAATPSHVAAQPSTATVASSPVLAGAALRDALRRGGYVLYFRHTSTDFGQNDDGMTSFDDCSKQRNLTDKGRAEARAIGAVIARLKIPVGDVLASPYCRTLETARLLFGHVTMSMDVRGGPATPPTPDRYDALRKLLSTRLAGPTNLAIVSHGNPFYAVAGPPYLAEGEVAIVEPRGAEGFHIVAKITRDAWDSLDR